MANEYTRIVKRIRREASKLTLAQQRQILKIYEDAIASLAEQAGKAKDNTLTKRWLLDYQEELEKAKRELRRKLNQQIRQGIDKAAELGTEPEKQVLGRIFRAAGIDTGDSFKGMFSQVRENVVRDIISGDLYKDKKTLSQRIWNYGQDFEKDIQYTINQAMLEKKSAIELAKDLEKYVEEPAKRPTTWGKVYPNLKNKRVDYNAMRLARTAINHAYQTATIQSSQLNPFVEGIEWQSAMIHGRTCELCMERHGKVYKTDEVPLDHPNGLCTMLPVIRKSFDDIAGELKAWVEGGSNQSLDEWYNEYGMFFM